MIDDNKNFEYLEELLRTARSLISPITYHDHLKKIMDRDFRKKLFDGNSKCYLTINYKGRDIPFFPICNRTALEDPRIIKFSLKLAKRMVGRDDIDQDSLNLVIMKLEGLHKKFTKQVPRPTSMAVKKGKATKEMSKIKRYLKRNIKGDKE